MAIPQEVQAGLSEGFLAPHRNIKQAPGVSFYFGHLLAESEAERLNAKTRLRAWTPEAGFLEFPDKWPIGPHADFDFAGRRILVSSVSDDARSIPALYEIDWSTRHRRRLEVVDQTAEMGLGNACYLEDGGIAVRDRSVVRVLRRDGDRLSTTPVELDVGETIYLGAVKRLIVTPSAIWEIGRGGLVQRAAFESAQGVCVAGFDGAIRRYTSSGCDRLVGPGLRDPVR